MGPKIDMSILLMKERNLSNFLQQSFLKGNFIKNLLLFMKERKKPLKCQICKYRCSQKGTLKRHVAFIHEGKKPVKFLTLNILKRGPK